MYKDIIEFMFGLLWLFASAWVIAIVINEELSIWNVFIGGMSFVGAGLALVMYIY